MNKFVTRLWDWETNCILVFATESRKSDSHRGYEDLGSFLCECFPISFFFSSVIQSLFNTHIISACSQYRKPKPPRGLGMGILFFESFFFLSQLKYESDRVAWKCVWLAPLVS